jgi:microcompartment protein CcmK/EutM
MELARVIGRCVCEVKYPTLKGIRLMVIQPVDHDQNNVGDPVVAVDNLQSGPGDLVSWVAGREAALTLPNTYAPVDVGIVEIVDDVWGDRRHL